MRYRVETVREGELLGPVDWNYDFRQHFNSYGCSEERKDEFCERSKELLKKIADDPYLWKVTLSHSYASRNVLAVGMYDGWPYWKPTPAVMTSGTLGAEWHFFYDLKEAEKVPA